MSKKNKMSKKKNLIFVSNQDFQRLAKSLRGHVVIVGYFYTKYYVHETYCVCSRLLDFTTDACDSLQRKHADHQLASGGPRQSLQEPLHRLF